MADKVLITDLRTAEARSAAEYLNRVGYEVSCIPEGFPLWEESQFSAYLSGLKGRLTGVLHPAPPLFLSAMESASEDEFSRARDEGAIAAWSVAKVVGKRMMEQGGGTIIFLNSIHAEKPLGKGFLFSAGCGAVQMLSREINQDYGTQGIRSYFIQRGPSTADPDGRNDLSSQYYGLDYRYPGRKIPGPEALNPLLAFLLTDAAAPLTGSDLRADGGMTMYYGERITEEQAGILLRKNRQEKEVTIIGEK